MEEKQPSITVRPSKELYEKIRKYADKTGESMGGAMIKIAEEFFKGIPSPEPSPTLPSEIPEEIAELPGRVKKLDERVEECLGYMKGLSDRVNRLDRLVSQLLGAVGSPPMPQIPPPPFGVAVKKAPGRRKKK